MKIKIAAVIAAGLFSLTAQAAQYSPSPQTEDTLKTLHEQVAATQDNPPKICGGFSDVVQNAAELRDLGVSKNTALSKSKIDPTGPGAAVNAAFEALYADIWSQPDVIPQFFWISAYKGCMGVVDNG